jgi:sRNA-binding protein
MAAHEKTTTTYRYSREESEQIIFMLCKHYPGCFFEKHRRPLKKNITTDIIRDQGFDVSPEAITAAVSWYMTNFSYEQTLIAGAKRVDLEGNEVGTVTEPEAIAAQQRMTEINKKRNEQAKEAGPVRVLSQMYADGKISDDTVKKLDAPPVPPKNKTAHTAPAPEFVPLYEVLANANTVIININDPTMRTAVLKTLLDLVITKFQQVRKELEERTH